MSALVRRISQDDSIQSRGLVDLQKRLAVICNSRYTIPLLLALGVIRVIVFLLAYPLAHGADHLDYYLHAAFLAGVPLPVAVANTVPLYPVLLAMTYYGLGSSHLIFGLQLAMSAVEGTLYYLGLRRSSPLLAFVCALVITGDAQVGILYNFTSTEPLYLFLLTATFCLLLSQSNRRGRGRRTLTRDLGLGALLFGLTIARTVGRFLYIPLGLLFIIGTRDWRRGLVLAVGFIAASLIFNTLYSLRVATLASSAPEVSVERITNVNDTMVLVPLAAHNLLSADNGPLSAELIAYHSTCEAGQGWSCVIDKVGGQSAYLRLINGAYLEMVRAKTVEYASLTLKQFSAYLSMSGQQFQGSPSPSDAQCSDLPAVVDSSFQSIAGYWLYNDSNFNRQTLHDAVADVEGLFCPPSPHVASIQAFVDAVALRYRSLGRPHPLIWYGALILLVAFIPWARRRMWLPLLAAGAILVNHAAISALLINVQPRYVVVTNPFRAVLLLLLVYVVAGVIIRVVDEWLLRRETGAQSN
jgi:hypothetical protein